MESIDLGTGILREFGLGAYLAIAIFLLMVWLLRRVFKHIDGLVGDQREERKSFHALISNHMGENTKTLSELVETIRSHERLTTEVNSHIKNEHKEILQAMRDLNHK